MPLPGIIAKRIVTEWMKACKAIAARNKTTPFISLTRGDEHYFVLLQEMIAREIERIQDETTFIP